MNTLASASVASAGSTAARYSLVLNLSDTVSWLPAMVSAAARAGIACVREVGMDDTGVVVYLGDVLPPFKPGRREVYWLAACSLPPNDSEGDWQIEAETMARVDATLVVSASEMAKVCGAVPKMAHKVHKAGMPLSVLADLDRFRGVPRIAKRVCFAGQLRPVKNPALEVDIIRALVACGYECLHVAGRGCAHAEDVARAGGRVLRQVSRDEYLETLASAAFFVSTSHAESLCLSGLEAMALGTIPIVPDHSGFRDWCPAICRYAPLIAAAAVDRLRMLGDRPPSLSRHALAWYEPRRVFDRVGAVVRRMSPANATAPDAAP